MSRHRWRIRLHAGVRGVNTDFADAAGRHWTDAETLFDAKRWPNADQLYGFAAECTLKAIMVGLGMSVVADRPQYPSHRVHIDKLWNEFRTFAAGQVEWCPIRRDASLG
ncbi:MAG: hypothetical protein IT350_00950 [Deltaproteobacteria bacterium]|nr:hypothetical protein [Deltaproteobacteria bacterium]